MNENYTIATRGSKLALIQTEIVSNSLRSIFPSTNFDIIKIKSMGDIQRNKFLFSVNEKGIFEKEVNRAVLDGRADFAVHSIKDIPTELDGDLIIASILKRESANDVLIGNSKMKLEQLPKNSRIGTSSLRRAVQIKRKNPNVNVIPIRGNVESRVKKCIEGPFDALVLAEAGLKRLELSDHIIQRFSYRDFVPAPGQGAIGIVCRKDNKGVLGVLQEIEDKSTRYAIDAERSLIQYLDAGCRFPVGAIAIPNMGTQSITLHASVFSADGSESINIEKTDVISNAAKIGKQVANDLLSRGAGDFAHEWREALEKWSIQK